MTRAPSGAELLFRYDAVRGDGGVVSDTLRAPDEAAALQELSAQGLMVTRLDAVAPRQGRPAKPLRLADRMLIMRQLALMLGAGVPLLEAVDTVDQGMARSGGADPFQAVAAALERGATLADAMERHAPGFPAYVYAMLRVGEASGRIAEVLSDAADQMAYEDRLRRDIVNALTYPAFLACAGLATVIFIFVEVVPRFSAMLRDGGDRLPWASRLVLDIGLFVDAHLAALAFGAAALVLVGAGLSGQAWFRSRLLGLARRAPLTGDLLRAYEIGLWARLTALTLRNGMPLLPATALARGAVSPGPFHDGLIALETDLRAGMSIDDSLGRRSGLAPMDLSLLRAGRRSGALATMFAHLADSYDNRLKDGVKRSTALLEPVAIGTIAVVVGAVALSLVLALASLYETIN